MAPTRPPNGSILWVAEWGPFDKLMRAGADSA